MTARRSLRRVVVDDARAMVGAIPALVGLEGHQVVTAYDGLTAVKRFAEERPDIVLLDLAMPGPDGFTVAGLMRAAGPAPALFDSGGGGGAAGGGVLGVGPLRVGPGRHEARVGDVTLRLTPIEFRLLEALARSGGDVVPHHRLPPGGGAPQAGPDGL